MSLDLLVQRVEALERKSRELEQRIRQDVKGERGIIQAAIRGHHLSPDIVGSGLALTNDQLNVPTDGITTAKIADGAVTSAKLASGIRQRFVPQTSNVLLETTVGATGAWTDLTSSFTPTGTMVALLLRLRVTGNTTPAMGSNLAVQRKGGGLYPSDCWVASTTASSRNVIFVICPVDADRKIQYLWTRGGGTDSYDVHISEKGYWEEY